MGLTEPFAVVWQERRSGINGLVSCKRGASVVAQP